MVKIKKKHIFVYIKKIPQQPCLKADGPFSNIAGMNKSMEAYFVLKVINFEEGLQHCQQRQPRHPSRSTRI